MGTPVPDGLGGAIDNAVACHYATIDHVIEL
jgi:hypothetical protein